MSLVDYGPDQPTIQEIRGGYLIPVGVESYERTNPDDTTTTCYRALQVWVPVISELELDAAFGDLKEQYPDDYRAVALYPIRQKRDALLAASDWTQAADAPVDHAAWRQYRQALRDVTQAVDPFNVQWPEVQATEVVADWSAFFDALLTSDVFAVARQAAAVDVAATAAYTDLAAGLGLAKQGNPNIPALQTGFSTMLSLLELTQEQQSELASLIAEHEIPISLP